MGITFKREPKETGLYAIGNSTPGVNIKYNKKWFGYITPPSWQHHGWDVSFMVYKDNIMEDKNPNCDWKWVYIKQKFETEEEARQYMKDHEKEITAMNLRFSEE